MIPTIPESLWHTHHDIQALVGGPLCHYILDARFIDIHGPTVLDHCTSNVEVLRAVHFVVAVEEVETSFVCKSCKSKKITRSHGLDGLSREERDTGRSQHTGSKNGGQPCPLSPK